MWESQRRADRPLQINRGPLGRGGEEISLTALTSMCFWMELLVTQLQPETRLHHPVDSHSPEIAQRVRAASALRGAAGLFVSDFQHIMFVRIKTKLT